eukprot:SAG22_NODE_611_length_8586_cov_8.288795_1_plen_234_part_00
MSVYIRPESRRAGLATKLLKGVLAAAETAGVQTVNLRVERANASAQALYSGAGFGALSLDSNPAQALLVDWLAHSPLLFCALAHACSGRRLTLGHGLRPHTGRRACRWCRGEAGGGERRRDRLSGRCLVVTRAVARAGWAPASTAAPATTNVLCVTSQRKKTRARFTLAQQQRAHFLGYRRPKRAAAASALRRACSGTNSTCSFSRCNQPIEIAMAAGRATAARRHDAPARDR